MPRPELELALLVAGCEARRVALAGRIRELLRIVDYAALARILGERRLLPLVGSRVLTAAVESAPPPFEGAVADALASARARGLAIESATRRAVEILVAARVPALPLKGPLLAADLHGDVGLRETADVDLLVPAAQLETAAAALSAEGYSGRDGRPRSGGLPDLHLRLSRGDGPLVELHWRIHWYEGDFARDMLARASPGGDGLLRPATVDLAASLLLFHARDGMYGLRLPADLAALWDRRACELPASSLAEHARRYPALARALTAAAASAEDVSGVPARSWLGDTAAKGRRVQLSTRLANWSQEGDTDQLRANISLVGGLLGPPGSSVAFARRELLPSSGGARARMSHGVKVCVRFAFALWRVRRRPWVAPPTAGSAA